MAERKRLSPGSGYLRQPTPNLDSYSGGDDGTMLMEDVRNVVSQTHNKIGSLRQALSEKNQIIRRERALRKAAEQRELDKSSEATFVDIYAGSNPSVNEELKDWLSPAKQRDRLLRGGKPHPKDKEAQRNSAEHPARDREGVDQTDRPGDNRSLVSDSDMEADENERIPTRQEQPSRRSRRRRAHDDYYPESRPDQRLNATMPPALGSWYNPAMAYPVPVPLAPWLPSHGQPPTDQAHWPAMGPNPSQLARTEVSPSSGPPPVRRHSDVGAALADLQDRLNTDSQTMATDSKDTMKPTATTMATQMEPQSTSTPIRIVVDRGTSAKTELEDGVPLLLSELGSTKDVNKELQEKLQQTEQEIESLRLSQSLTEATLEARVAARAAAVVEEVYAAQKERDAAIMSRLRLANEERDESVARLRRLESKDDFDSGTDVDDDYDPTDMSMTDLLAKLSASDTGPEIALYGKSILGQIHKVKSSKGRIVAEEMRTIIQEKDAALAKCKKLEREAIELRRITGGLAVRNNTEQSLQAQLEATRKERDVALTKVRKLQEELDEVRVFYSLHKSLSQEADLRDQFNTTLGNYTERVKASDEVLAQTKLTNNQLSSQLKQLQNERNSMASQLQQALQAQRDTQAKLNEKERLIAVLRKKVAEGTVKVVN